MTIGENGILYLALGAPYLSMALTSMCSLRVHNPEVPVCIVTNATQSEPVAPFWRCGQDRLVTIDNTELMQHKARAGFVLKTMADRHTPFKNTLFLDCDTVVLGDVSTLFAQLDYFDMLACPATHTGSEARRVLVKGKFPYTRIGHFNTGVLAFGSSQRVTDFFKEWRSAYHSIGAKNDEPSFVEALYYSSAQLLPIEPRWNSGDRWLDARAIRDALTIWHYKVRLEPLIEKLLIKSGDWFEPTEEGTRHQTLKFIESRRELRREHTLRWQARKLVTVIRGRQTDRLLRAPSAQFLRDIVATL